mmetsp:Transcript_40442/g.96457  ORF Transcript_40442/g.96457 Transcript_40442/m.96457 type:complete len:227 (+) Transcript_40442:286-966(+)
MLFCNVRSAPSADAAQEEFSTSTNSRSSKSRRCGRICQSRALKLTRSGARDTRKESSFIFGTDTEMRSCSLDCPQENKGVAGCRSFSCSFLRRFSSAAFFAASNRRASSCFFFSFRCLSASRRRFLFSLSFLAMSFCFSSSFFSCSRRRFRLSSSSSGLTSAALPLPLFGLGFSASRSSASAAFFRPIISPTSTSPFSFFSVVIIFLIICCLSSSARSSACCWSFA